MSFAGGRGRGIRSLGTNVVLNVVAQALLVLAGLGSIPVLTRILSMEEYAFFAFLMLFITSMVLLDGLRPPFIQLIHRHRVEGTEADFLKIAARVNVGFAGVMGVGSFAAFHALAPPTAARADTVMLAVATVALFMGALPAAQIAASQRIGLVQFVRAVSVATTYGLFVVLAVAGDGVAHFTGVILAMNVALYAAYRVLARRHTPPRGGAARETSVDAVTIVRQCGHGMATGMANTVAHFSDRLLVYLLLPATAYAAYSVAYDSAIRLNAVPLMVTYPLFTWLSQHLETSREAALRVYQSVGKAVLMVMLLLGSTAIYWSDEIVRLLAGAAYAGSAGPFRLIVIAAMLTTLSAIAAAVLRASGDFRSQWKTTLTGSIVCLASGLVLIPRFGIMGGALALIAGRIFADLPLSAVAARAVARQVRDHGLPHGASLRLMAWGGLAAGVCVWSYLPFTAGAAEYAASQVALLASGWFGLFTREERRAGAALLRRISTPRGAVGPVGVGG